MNRANIEESLREKGITPTAIRILIYRCLQNASYPLSLSDIEVELGTVDKSTISRTLNIYKEQHLVHALNDGSGAVKYELCKSDIENHDDMHVHFRCEKCGATICFNEIPIPSVTLPEGYEIQEMSYIVSGVCRNCSRK